MKGNIMGNVIGKVLATDKNPSTMEEFYFWTKPELILNPFDVVKVEHIQEQRIKPYEYEY